MFLGRGKILQNLYQSNKISNYSTNDYNIMILMIITTFKEYLI